MTDIVSKERAQERRVVANEIREIYFKLKNSTLDNYDSCEQRENLQNCLEYFDTCPDFDVTDPENDKDTLKYVKRLLTIRAEDEEVRTELSDYVWELEDALDDRESGYFFTDTEAEKNFFRTIYEHLCALGLLRPLHDRLLNLTLDEFFKDEELIDDLWSYRF